MTYPLSIIYLLVSRKFSLHLHYTKHANAIRNKKILYYYIAQVKSTTSTINIYKSPFNYKRFDEQTKIRQPTIAICLINAGHARYLVIIKSAEDD